MSDTPTFKFLEFNERRAMRGAEAARVEVTYPDGESEWVWMSKRDAGKNMATFGMCDALTAVQEAYMNFRRASLSPTPGDTQ